MTGAPPSMGRRAAGDLLAAAAAGRTELLGALDARPLLVIDLATPGPTPLPWLPWLPAVVVGIAGDPAADTAGVDVALTTDPSPPAPWVAVGDLEAAAGDLAGRVAASPRASVTLAQVLRAGVGLPLTEALLVESLAYSTLQAGPEHRAWLAGRRDRRPGRRTPAPTPDLTPGPAVEVVRRAGELTVTLVRPGRHNAFSAEVRDGLTEALSLAAADPSITAVHLRGAGPSFCSGGDLDEFGTGPDPSSAHLVRTARSCARLVAALGQPVTAHLHGHCIGAGIELAAAATRVLAAPDTRIRLPEVGLGLIPGAGGTATLPPRIGCARTAWLALSGATLDIATALAWGLVDGTDRGG